MIAADKEAARLVAELEAAGVEALRRKTRGYLSDRVMGRMTRDAIRHLVEQGHDEATIREVVCGRAPH